MGKRPPLIRQAVCVVATIVLVSACLQQTGQHSSPDLTACLQQYHSASPDPLPSNGQGARFLHDVVFAVPCEGLAPAGVQRWSVLVVAPDDKTVRIYFVGGLLSERCDLLREVNISEDLSTVNIVLAAGADPSISPAAACSAVGQSYVTEVTLSQKLGKRTLTGPSNQGEIVHL